MKRKDVPDGTCFRYLNDTINKPLINSARRPADLPEEWSFSWMSKDTLEYENKEVEILEHYSTHRVPPPITKALMRRDLQMGDCFKYIDNHRLVDAYVVTPVGSRITLPPYWRASNDMSASPHWDSKVELLENFSTHPIPTPRKRTSMVSPTKVFVSNPNEPRFGEALIDGLSLEVCLKRFIENQQDLKTAHGLLFKHLLTSAQKLAASVEYSRLVKVKTVRSKEEKARKDLYQVVCERDEDGE